MERTPLSVPPRRLETVSVWLAVGSELSSTFAQRLARHLGKDSGMVGRGLKRSEVRRHRDKRFRLGLNKARDIVVRDLGT